MFEWRTGVSIRKLLGREIEVSQIVKRCFLKKKGSRDEMLWYLYVKFYKREEEVVSVSLEYLGIMWKGVGS